MKGAETKTDAIVGLTPSEHAFVEARKKAMPASATCRGMFIQDLVDAAKAADIELGLGNFIAFKKYPLGTYLDAIAISAKSLFPSLPFAVGAEKIGMQVYPMFSASLVGRAIFSVAGRDFQKVASLASRAYAASLYPSTVVIESNRPGEVVVLMRDIWPFVESFQVGIWKGGLVVCNEATDDFVVETLSECDARYTIRW